MYKLYDRILSTCADPKRAYLHLSVVAALADPLPISEISKLLSPSEGRDVEIVLVQLQSVMDIPADSNLPVNIYHSSIRDYVSDSSNCGLPEVQHMTSPHSLFARSCLRLMISDITGRANTALLDALLKLKGQSQAMESDNPKRLKSILSFIVQPPEPLQVVIYLLWLRGGRDSGLQHWLGNLDGRSWRCSQPGKDWLQTLADASFNNSTFYVGTFPRLKTLHLQRLSLQCRPQFPGHTQEIRMCMVVIPRVQNLFFAPRPNGDGLFC